MSQRNLRLDRVVGSQPELGPSVPDGGYGWVIFIASFILQICIPSILSSYGILMLYSRIESSALSEDPKLWDTALIATPIVYAAFLTLADPWSRTIVATSTWPRLVTTTGIFLTCAGLLIEWLSMKDSLGLLFYMFAGAITGFGSSLALRQSETLLSQYFRLKLRNVTNLLYCAHSIGFILVPIILAYLLIRKGILHSLLIYQTILLQCVIVILVFKKPLYLKEIRRRYELLQNASEDDEMIFAKDEPVNLSQTTSNSNTTQPISSTSHTKPSDTGTTVLSNKPETNNRKTLLTETFADEFRRDLGTAENSTKPQEPKPLFTEIEMTGSDVYTFDNNVATTDAGNLNLTPPTNFRQEIAFLFKLSFYKSLFLTISIKYANLLFWILFPTYLFVEMDSLHMSQVCFLVGMISISCLAIAIISSFLPVYGNNRQIATSVFCILNAVGFFILSDAGTESWLLFGAIHVTTSLTALHILQPFVIKYQLGIDYDKAHTLLHTLAAISLLLLLTRDISYKNCFRITSLLQVISGFMLLCNVLVKYFRKLFTAS